MSVEEISLDLNRKEPPDEFDVILAKVKKFAAVAGVIGGAFGLCFSIAAWLLTDKPLSRGHFAMPFICGFGLSAMVTGVALLLAPESFFNSETGREYMQAIGTRNVRSAKIAITVALLLGCVAAFVLALGALQIAGIIA
ncbi:MAG: hypothetical protein JWN70_1938 [Planctomycetaceae bacterium]|nr:hypothetical protein [Planctomycetaceae bacterium]